MEGMFGILEILGEVDNSFFFDFRVKILDFFWIRDFLECSFVLFYFGFCVCVCIYIYVCVCMCVEFFRLLF